MATRILIVEDEDDIRELIRFHLDQAGFAVEEAADGAAAASCLVGSRPELVILDLMLPDQSGVEVCRQIRSNPELADLPVIMLTAKSEEIDRVVGFEVGADDYVTKPFSPRELVLRVKALLRRTAGSSTAGERLRCGVLDLDFARRHCRVEGRQIDLTAKEFELLASLARRDGRVMTREALIEEVWGPNTFVTLRSIDTHLKRLRSKLGVAAPLIETVRGVGYRFAE